MHSWLADPEKSAIRNTNQAEHHSGLVLLESDDCRQRLNAERWGAIRETLVNEKALDRRSRRSEPRIKNRDIENRNHRNRWNPLRRITIHVRSSRLRGY